MNHGHQVCHQNQTSIIQIAAKHVIINVLEKILDDGFGQETV